MLPLPLVTAVSAVGYMLETPVVSGRYSFMSHLFDTRWDMSSDNPPVGDYGMVTPDNQQERLSSGWVVGFVDGEGCFSVSIYRNPTTTLGWQVRPEFAVAQSASSREVLDMFVEFFGCGKVYRNRRYDDHRQDILRYCVRRRADLTERIIPFFRVHPLRTAKRDDFEKFVEIVEMMNANRHLTPSGVGDIARIVETMNHRKPSEYLRILRDHTPTLSETRGRDGPDPAAT